MRALWIGFSVLILAGIAYVWLKPERLAETKALEAKIEETMKDESIASKPIALEARVVPIEEKLQASKPILQEKEKLRQEVAHDPHGSPAALMQAGQALGEIAELEAKHPERKEEFVRYYKDCFESSQTMTVTRVQCLKRYLKSTQLSPRETENVLANLPRPIQNLYRKSEATR